MQVPDAYFFSNSAGAPTNFRSVFTMDGKDFYLTGRSVANNISNYYADSGIRYMRYGDFGTTQLAYPAGVMDARYCGVAPNSPYTASNGGPQMICATRDGFNGNWFGLQASATAHCVTIASYMLVTIVSLTDAPWWTFFAIILL